MPPNIYATDLELIVRVNQRVAFDYHTLRGQHLHHGCVRSGHDRIALNRESSVFVTDELTID